MSQVQIRLNNRTGQTIYYISRTERSGDPPRSILWNGGGSFVSNGETARVSSPFPSDSSNIGADWVIYFWAFRGNDDTPSNTTPSNSRLILNRNGTQKSFTTTPGSSFNVNEITLNGTTYRLTFGSGPNPPPISPQQVVNNSGLGVIPCFFRYTNSTTINYNDVRFSNYSQGTSTSRTIQGNTSVNIPPSSNTNTPNTAVYFWNNLSTTATAPANAYFLVDPNGRKLFSNYDGTMTLISTGSNSWTVNSLNVIPVPKSESSSVWKWVIGIGVALLVVFLLIGLVVLIVRPKQNPPMKPRSLQQPMQPQQSRTETVQRVGVVEQTDIYGRKFLVPVHSSTTTSATVSGGQVPTQAPTQAFGPRV